MRTVLYTEIYDSSEFLKTRFSFADKAETLQYH